MTELLGSCIGLALLSALYEGFKVAREYLEYRMTSRRRAVNVVGACECNPSDQTSTSTTTNSTIVAILDDDKAHGKKR